MTTDEITPEERVLRENATRLWNDMKDHNGFGVWIGPQTLRNECIKFHTTPEIMQEMGYVTQGKPPTLNWQWFRINEYPVYPEHDYLHPSPTVGDE